MGLKVIPTNWTLPQPCVEDAEFLQRLIANEGTAKVFPPGFPHAIHQALALPLAKPGMSQANIMRSVYTLAAAGAEMTAIAHPTNLCQEQLLTIMGGTQAAIPIAEVKPEDFNFEGNLNGEL